MSEPPRPRGGTNKIRHVSSALLDARTGPDAGDDPEDYFDCLMMLPYIMVPPEKQEAIWRKAAEKRAERERSRVEDKVVSWAREVANTCS